MATPGVLATIDDSRALAAARYLSTRLQRARMDAIVRSADVGFRITQSSSGYAGTDPIKLGASNILTFSPAGTSSPGSLYVLGRNRAQYVIRVLGQTGKTRVLKFDARARQWNPL